MSITPTFPNLPAQKMKSFWERPEGKMGMVFIAILLGVTLLAGYSFILPFILAMIVDTFHAMILIGIMVAVGLVLANKQFRSTIGLVFRLFMHAFTNWVMQIDPIGVLKDRLKTVRKRRENMGEQSMEIKRQKVNLKGIMEQNARTAKQNIAMALEARSRLGSSDASYNQRMQLQANSKSRAADRLKNANMSYEKLYNKLDSIDTFLDKWIVNIDFFIEDTTDEVKQQEIQFKTIGSAYSAYRTAMKVMKGDVNEQELYNSTMDFLAEDANRKLGEMEEIQKIAQNFMDTMDLQNAAVNNDALAELEKYEKKVLNPGSEQLDFLLPGANETRISTQRSSSLSTSSKDSYDDLLN